MFSSSAHLDPVVCAPRVLSQCAQTLLCACLGRCRHAPAATENFSFTAGFPCRVRNFVVLASQSHTHACCVRPALSWATELSVVASTVEPKNPLSRQRFSLFWPTLSRHRIAMSRHNYSLPWPTLLRQKTPSLANSVTIENLSNLTNYVST